MPPSEDLQRPGDLMSCCLLYEGNHTEWSLRMRVLLRAHGLEKWWLPQSKKLRRLAENDDKTKSTPWVFEKLVVIEADWFEKDDLKNDEDFNDWHEQFLMLIRSQLSPHLRRRMLDLKDRPYITQVFQMLCKIAQPFRRLWEFPPELRLKIFEYALGQYDQPVLINSNHDELLGGKPRPWPALLQVCRQMRRETLPMQYSKNQFYLSLLSPDGFVQEEPRMEDILRPWIEKVVCNNVCHLRHVTLHMWNGDDMHFDFKYSRQTGFSYVYSNCLDERSIQKLTEKMDKAQELIQLGRLGGESIVVAMMIAKKLFQSGVLQLED